MIDGIQSLLFPLELDRETQAQVLGTYAARLRFAAILAIIFLVTSIFPDGLLDSSTFWRLTGAKAVAAGLCAAVYLHLRTTYSLVYLTTISYLMVLAGAMVSGYMIYLTGGCHSHWALAPGLVILISASVSQLPPRIMAIAFTICFAGYFIPVLLVGNLAHAPLQTYSHLFFYAAFGAMSISVAAFQHRMTLQSIAGIRRVRDVTGALRRSEEELTSKSQELNEHKERALDGSRAESEFLANISHELRTPLTSIIGFSNLLERSGQKLGGDEVEMLKKIQAQGNALLSLIENLVDLSAISSSSLRMELKPVLVPLVIHQVVDAAQLSISQMGHKVTVDCRIESLKIMADHDRLVQALGHLLSNALKFTPKGAGEIVIGCKRTNDHAEIFVRDRGIGIEADKIDYIFKAFRQLDGSSTRKRGGAGIGLPIVKSIIAMHGGSIRVVSAPGQGAEFICLLPLAPEPASEKFPAR